MRRSCGHLPVGRPLGADDDLLEPLRECVHMQASDTHLCAAKELALYVVKFVLEGLINASPKGSVTENPAMQVPCVRLLRL